MAESLQTLLEKRDILRTDLQTVVEKQQQVNDPFTLHRNDTMINYRSSKLRGLDNQIMAKARKQFPNKTKQELRREFDINGNVSNESNVEQSITEILMIQEEMASKLIGKDRIKVTVVQQDSERRQLLQSLLSSYIERARQHMRLDTNERMTLFYMKKNDEPILSSFIEYWNRSDILCTPVCNGDHWIIYMSW